jgi:hypothetical protein
MLEAAWQTADPWHLSLTFRTARWAVMPIGSSTRRVGRIWRWACPPPVPTGPPRRGISTAKMKDLRVSVDLASVRYERQESVVVEASLLGSLAVFHNRRTAGPPLRRRFDVEIVHRASGAVVHRIRSRSDIWVQTAQTFAGNDLRAFTVSEFDGGTW